MSAEAQATRVVPPSRRRDKPVLSCTLCRRRKLKCDRQQPCKTCVDRGLSLSCTFVRNVPVHQEPRAPSSVHDRIDQLERLVTTLMSSKDEHDSPVLSSLSHLDHRVDENYPDIPGTPDRVKISSDTTSYTNSGHWTSILDGISELKEHLDQIPTSAYSRDGDADDIQGPDLLFGRHRHATKEELLAALPPRSEADQLLDSFFGSMDAAPTLIHRPSFAQEYEDFWKQPFEVPTMWLGLLYAILAVGARFQASNAEIPGSGLPSESLHSVRLNFYREKVVQALILANYTKCPPYTIETCMLYFGTEFVRSSDTQFSMWLLMSMIVRMAFRMGYHREPSRFANISPFRAEIRRRIWLVVLSIDLVSSAQVGLPRMIQPFMYDTQEPRNLNEQDLYEGMTELPPPQPETELTGLLYAIVLNRVRMIHAKFMDLMNATHQPPYREIMNLDGVLRRMYDQIPEPAKPMPVDDFDLANDMSAMRRLYLGLSFNKAELMLHRPYLPLGRTDPKYEYSRRVCLNAAYDMLKLQQRVDAEIRPGGKLWGPGWHIFTMSWYLSSIVAQDFLLATTIMVSDLDGDIVPISSPSPEPSLNGSRQDGGGLTLQQKVEILRCAQKIWYKASKRSYEAWKVAEAITLVLHKAGIDEHTISEPTSSGVLKEQISTVSPSPSFDINDFTTNTPNGAFFTMGNGGYGNPFLMEDMPIDPGTYSDAFNWSAMSADLPMHPFGDTYPSQQFQ